MAPACQHDFLLFFKLFSQLKIENAAGDNLSALPNSQIHITQNTENRQGQIQMLSAAMGELFPKWKQPSFHR